jgi:hypothetical protein
MAHIALPTMYKSRQRWRADTAAAPNIFDTGAAPVQPSGSADVGEGL